MSWICRLVYVKRVLAFFLTVHQRSEGHIRQVVALGHRYVLTRRGHHRPDPERDRLVEQTRQRLRQIHAAGQHFLPDDNPEIYLSADSQTAYERRHGRGCD